MVPHPTSARRPGTNPSPDSLADEDYKVAAGNTRRKFLQWSLCGSPRHDPLPVKPAAVQPANKTAAGIIQLIVCVSTPKCKGLIAPVRLLPHADVVPTAIRPHDLKIRLAKNR